MSTNDTHGNESIEPRTERALTEYMAVLPDGGDIYTVVGQNGGTYTVDGRDGRCTCPDAEYNLDDGERCKHQRRVAFATGERPVPAEVAGVDEQLAEHTEAMPRVVASDGGIIEAGDEGVILEDGDDERPEDCDCWDAEGELACWPCYREGFDVPNPEEPGADE
jgi:hypothetical protein